LPFARGLGGAGAAPGRAREEEGSARADRSGWLVEEAMRGFSLSAAAFLLYRSIVKEQESIDDVKVHVTEWR
jgi:hypothetical protein